MKVAFFSTRAYDKKSFIQHNQSFEHELTFFEAKLNAQTLSLAKGYASICTFVNDELTGELLTALNQSGVQLVALRCAGYNQVDLNTAHKLGLAIARVPAYSPYAVAEHSVALILALNRNITRAFNRVRDGNFALDGLLGFDLRGRTVGVIGTGKIGKIFTQIMKGFGCQLMLHDPYPCEELSTQGYNYVSCDELFTHSDIISLHCPLTPDTHHLINTGAVEKMKKGVMIINTSRGPLIDTRAVISGLKSQKIGYLGLDVYEEEGDLFFEDLSNHVIQDDVFARLQTFPNVLVTAHQAFFTEDALGNIATTTLENISVFEQGKRNQNFL